MTILFKAEGLDYSYGEISACRDLSFEVASGEIVTLIGSNGAGKSTTLRGVAGVMMPRAGRITFNGIDITSMPAYERAMAGIALVPEGRRVFPYLTVLENLEVGAFKYRKDKAKINQLIEEKFKMFPRLRERALQRAGTLSGGEQQMLALSRALMSEPKLLCLDEPSLGLAPLVVQEIFRTIIDINSKGMSILLVEQNASYALRTATRGYVLKNGSILTSGSCDELKSDERVQIAYLGKKPILEKL
jgi:branched-chain amino acid transport system ATP-binding protein